MLMILPGTICPQQGVSRLKETDVQSRTEQYTEGIRAALRTPGVHKVVFCDNSGNLPCEKELKAYAAECNTELELLCFEADASVIAAKGKGYGEGEIMEYVFRTSELIRGERQVCKLTGRLQVRNLARVLRHVKPDQNYFQGMYIGNRKHLADTRFYITTVEDYKKYLLHVHEQVDDSAHYYLEHAFSDAIRGRKMKYRNMSVYPDIVGISGSSGRRYGLPIYKKVLKQLFGRLNLMKV